MKIIIEATPKEIADFVLGVQNQLKQIDASELANELYHFTSSSSESKE